MNPNFKAHFVQGGLEFLSRHQMYPRVLVNSFVWMNAHLHFLHRSSALISLPLADAFQLVSVRLPRSTSQEIEAEELSLVLDYVNQSPKCIAFGNEVRFLLLVLFFVRKISFLQSFLWTFFCYGDLILPWVTVFLLITERSVSLL